jgi:hypothetical protein
MTSATHKSTPSCLPPQLQQLAAIHGARKTTILFHFKYEVTKYDKLTVTKQNKLTNMEGSKVRLQIKPDSSAHFSIHYAT